MPKHRKVCPTCQARRFQGPFYRGHIISGKLQREETRMQCVSCNNVFLIEALREEPVPEIPAEPDEAE